MTKKAAEKKVQRERIEQVEAAIRREIAEIVPEVEALPPVAVDEGLVQAFDLALRSAQSRVDEARTSANGSFRKNGS